MLKYKNIIRKLVLLFIAIFLFAGSYIFQEKLFQTSDIKIDQEKFRKAIFLKEDELNFIISQIAKNIVKDSSVTSFSDYTRLINIESLKSKGYTILIYTNDTISFWSDNAISLSSTFSSSKLAQKVINLNNGWYIVNSKKEGNKTIVGLILVKHQYSYKNKFLDNDFPPDFNLPSSVKVSFVSLSYSKDIYDRENNFLFSLVPTNSVVSVNPYSNQLVFMYFLGLVFLLVFFQHTVCRYRWGILILLVVVVGIRFVMLKYKLPLSLYTIPFFGPEYFAASVWLPSLGDFLINVILIFFFSYNFFIPFKTDAIQKLQGWKKYSVTIALSVLLILLIGLYFGFIQMSFKSLIIDSSLSFEVYKVLKLTFYSLVGFIIISLLFISFSFLVDKVIHFISQIIQYQIFLGILIVVGGGLIALARFIQYPIDIYSLIFPFVFILSIAFIRYKKREYKYFTFVLLILIISIYTEILITDTVLEKEKGVSKVLVSKLVTERDPIAEHLLKDIQDKISNDKELEQAVFSNYVGTNQQVNSIFKLLQKKYFRGYWGKYELEVFLCGTSNRFDRSNELENCSGYFRSLVEKYGRKLPYLNYYYLDMQNGSVSYLGAVDFKSEVDSAQISLYIKLGSRLLVEELGYPELLLDNKLNKTSLYSEYSYAKYKYNELVTKSGVFPYDLRCDKFAHKDQEYAFFTMEDYEHIVYNIDKENTLILSHPKLKFIELLVSFSYIFLFYNILLVIGLYISELSILTKNRHFDFKTKLQLSMLIILLMSILLVGGGTIYYNILQYENKHNNNISEKIQSVVIQLEQIFSQETELRPDWRTIDYAQLDEFLTKMSRVFFADINLYDVNGNLMATSRPEVFERGLIGKKINPEAYLQLSLNKKAKFIHEETIGDLTYTSVYVPFRNAQNKTLAFLNLPYFTKPGLLKKEISNLVVAVVNLYVLLFLLSIVVAVFIANKVTQPLRFIEHRFRQIELGKKYEQIEYKGHDEIGSLVKEYNRMVVELAESIELLAKSERESAWREMAKQIAHEIKNPLTPMKLSVQFLLRSWKNKDATFDQRFERVTNTMIEQIDNLSSIAAEFSNFAKMPKANNQVFNVVNTVKDILLLFENTDNCDIKIELHNNKEVKIFADEKQISRVFINLIKNAIQSVPTNKQGFINVELLNDGENVTIMVEDNGTGITEDQRNSIFTPNFTTKSSGMGMGLAIVKNIVENANGKIWFETVIGTGTKFFVELQIEKDNLEHGK
jgi:signal transduction histidine kinase